MLILFRRIRENDLEMILSWRMSPEVSTFMYTDPVLTMEKQLKWFKIISSDKARKDWIVNIDNADVGLLTISKIDEVSKRCEWAYYIASSNMRGKGIGRNIELNVYHYVFESLKLNKLCCEVFSFNEKVIHIHKKYGSIIEGVRRQHIFKNGCFYDIVEMAILQEDWEENVKGKFDFEKGHFEE